VGKSRGVRARTYHWAIRRGLRARRIGYPICTSGWAIGGGRGIKGESDASGANGRLWSAWGWCASDAGVYARVRVSYMWGYQGVVTVVKLVYRFTGFRGMVVTADVIERDGRRTGAMGSGPRGRPARTEPTERIG